jgi:drug/metabolite transporter (DMT)-like permease
MRVLAISAIVLILAGVWIIVRPPSYSQEERVFKLGDIEAKMQQQHPVPGWIGGIALGAGAVLLVVGLRKR